MTSRGRSISYSEISTALTCQARHSFAYTGRLLDDGMVLKPKRIAPVLSDGRAWGAGVQAWHSRGDPDHARYAAHGALLQSIADDVEGMSRQGLVVDPARTNERANRLLVMLDHYMNRTDRLGGLTMVEQELDVPILSRGGSRSSSRYRFQGYLDGFVPEDDLAEWLVEIKLRKRLTEPDVLERSRQIRWYAWARQRLTGHRVVGVIVDETLNVAPHPPNRSKRGKLSHAVEQITTEQMYLDACMELNELPRDGVREALRARVWGQRVPVIFSPSELEEAGRELVSAAQTIHDLDSGRTYPIRNAGFLCRHCDYRPICNHPNDRLYADSMFIRQEPKRDALNIPTQAPNTQSGQVYDANPFARDTFHEPT